MLLFVSMFCGSPSQYLWEEERGVTMGREKHDDAMMALLPSLQLVQDDFREDISRKNHDSIRHIAGLFVDGGRHPPQPILAQGHFC